jgi:hypothetical protein
LNKGDSKGRQFLFLSSDVDSYNLYLNGDNPWEVEAYVDKNGNSVLHLENTVKSILKRVDKGFTFFGPASVRNLPWYHLLWISAAPPPVISLAVVLLMSAKSDNCTSAIVETMRWQ